MLSALLLCGCKRQVANESPGAPAASGAQMQAHGEDEHHDHSKAHEALANAPRTPIVSLLFGDKSAAVSLDTLSAVNQDGKQVVKLTDAWAAAKLGDADGLQFDFVGDDEFRPSSRPKCPKLITSQQLSQGFINPVTRDVTWEASLALPGCYRVRSVKRIEASRPATAP